MTYNVHLETFAATRPTAVVRRRVQKQELSKVIPECCGLVWNVIKSQQIKGAGRHVTLYLDDAMNVEVGVELESPIAGYGEVVGSQLPAGTLATTTHLGPYQNLGDAHRAIQEWCAANGHKLAGPSWEIYAHWVDEWNRDPSKIRTDVYYLIAP